MCRGVVDNRWPGQEVGNNIKPLGPMWTELTKDCQTVGSLNGTESIFEVKAGNHMVRVLLFARMDMVMAQSFLGGANPTLPALEMEIQVKLGLGKEKMAENFGPLGRTPPWPLSRQTNL